MSPLQAELEALYRDAVSACRPEAVLGRRLAIRDETLALADISGAQHAIALPQHGTVRALAVGKSAAGTAEALATLLSERLSAGVAITPAAPQALPPAFRAWPADHPVPSARSMAAARAAIELAAQSTANDLLLVAISGGASALLALPAVGLTLAEVAATHAALIKSGAPIAAINQVRKHVSAIKGGRLRVAAPGRCLTVLLSDVLGSPPEAIGSGPTLPDASTYADALKVVHDYGVAASLPAAVVEHLQAGQRGEHPETPKPGDPIFARDRAAVLASPETLRHAALHAASQAGWEISLTHRADTHQTLGEHLVGLRRSLMVLRDRAQRRSLPQLGIWVGEPTLTVSGSGCGGRNSHLALCMARELRGDRDAAFLAAGSDGVDGSSSAAGAVVDGHSWAAAESLGLEPERSLANFDSATLHERVGSAVVTGPTGVNLLDLHLLAVLPPPSR